MRIIYLGTGGEEGFPSVFCECSACKKVRRMGGKNIKTRSGALIDNVLIDLSPDLFSQSVQNHLSLSGVTHVMITHSHTDHLNTHAIRLRMRELASVLEPGQEKKIKIYGNREVYRVIMDAVSKDCHVTSDRMEFIQIRAFERIRAEGLEFISLKANHKKDEECLLYAVQNETGCLLYANDTGELPEETLDFIRTQKLCFDLVSMDSARGTLPGDGHMGLSENLNLRRRLEEIGAVRENTRYYLNHFSHMCGLTPKEYRRLVGRYGFSLTYDGLKLEIGRGRVCRR